jgi:hypothetical protein
VKAGRALGEPGATKKKVDLGRIASHLGIIVGEEDSGGYYGGGSVKLRVGKFKGGVNVTVDEHGQLQYYLGVGGDYEW